MPLLIDRGDRGVIIQAPPGESRQNFTDADGLIKFKFPSRRSQCYMLNTYIPCMAHLDR